METETYRIHPYETIKVGKYTGYVWGYGKGSLSNSSAGVAILISGRIQEKHVVEIKSPEGWLQGRAGLVRVKGGHMDITAIVGYPPPDTGDKKQTNLQKKH